MRTGLPEERGPRVEALNLKGTAEVRPFVLHTQRAPTDKRLEELRANYEALSQEPSRKERGYSDTEHMLIIEELQDARLALAMYEEMFRPKPGKGT
jgi:hypothetical protein